MGPNMTTNHHDHDNEIRSKVVFGFWVYLMTDAIMFGSLFATYAVLHNNTYGGPGIQSIMSLPHVLIQTLVFLVSCLTYGLGYVSLMKGNQGGLKLWLLVTFVLGLVFLTMQYNEYACILAGGHSWQSSAFFSSYFTMTGVYSLHIVVGLIWMLVLLVQLLMQGTTSTMNTRFTCLGLYWNYLNIIWIFIFTIVYLMGAI